MFRTRLLSGIILLAIMITVVITGGNVLFAVLLTISLIGMTELYKVIGMDKSLPGFLGYAAGLSYYVLVYFEATEYQLMVFIFFLLLLMLFYVFYYPKYRIEQLAVTFFGLFYVSIMLSFIYQVRILEGGIWIVWLIFIGAWGSDTCAYAVGILLGKHKLAPKLSPKKSIEGSIGGIVGSALIGFLYATVCRNHITGIDQPQLMYAIIGACSSVLSQLGDLAASAIKRNHDIKDYGKLIPGHGGILDRFDSIIFTAPIVYYLTVLLR